MGSPHMNYQPIDGVKSRRILRSYRSNFESIEQLYKSDPGKHISVISLMNKMKRTSANLCRSIYDGLRIAERAPDFIDLAERAPDFIDQRGLEYRRLEYRDICTLLKDLQKANINNEEGVICGIKRHLSNITDQIAKFSFDLRKYVKEDKMKTILKKYKYEN